MTIKVCTKCGEARELSEYNRDGIYRRSECKKCSRQAGKVYRNSTNGNGTSAANRAYESSQKGRDRKARYRKTKRGRDADKRYRENNRLHKFARNAVTHEVEAGRMNNIKTLKCGGCGNGADHYHHHAGYDKKNWLNVAPLCITCHNLAHEGDKNGR